MLIFTGEWYDILILVLLCAIAVWLVRGVVWVRENEVGIVIKKWSRRSLEPHQKVALQGEAGVQVDTLAPGWHLYWAWKFTISKVRQVYVPPGQIAVVIANDGTPLDPEQLLGNAIECNHFQDGRAFLTRGGQQGRQRTCLTSGRYRVNTTLFTVITSDVASYHGLQPDALKVFAVPPDRIGIVTTAEGASLPEGDIAAPRLANHDDFQNPQKFIDGGGFKGLQEAFLTAGAWTLNPWFASVELVPLTTIPVGTVGVIVSYVGRQPSGPTGLGVNGQLVEPGFKGVWRTPLFPGRHPVNTFVMHVEIVPTHQITLDWSDDQTKPVTNYDSQLRALELTSKDGFTFDVAVTQVICIDGGDAPKMISLIGSTLAEERSANMRSLPCRESEAPKFDSIRNLITRVLKNLIDNHFRISAQNYVALDFLENRGDRQKDAIAHIAAGLSEYGVQSVGTFISKISLPPALMQMLSDRKLAQEEQKTLECKQETERERTQLMYLQALAGTQKELAENEQRVKITQLKASAESISAESKASSIRTIGQAETDVMAKNLEKMGGAWYFEIERLKQLARMQLPEVLVTGGIGQGSALDAAILQSLRQLARPGGAPSTDIPEA